MCSNSLLPLVIGMMAVGGVLALLFKSKARSASLFGVLSLLFGVVCTGILVFSAPAFELFFQVPILVLGAAGAIHSLGYLKGHGEERAGIYWFFYNITVASMLAVTFAVNGIGFLLFWELMGLASFPLVAFDYRSSEVRRAAWIYLLACEAGGLLIIATFVFSCNVWVTFLLAMLGFGLKIGFPLLHIWLPEAHPAAPAPVSALMSGAMIQLGFLGIARFGLSWGTPVAGSGMIFGMVFILLGVIGALGGIMFAMTRSNIKALLAYSSIENMGIIAMGFGLYLLACGIGNNMMACCGLLGAAFHMLNHALLKGGLFLGAGTVLKSVGTLNMEKCGGLLKKMPLTGSCFIINSCGLSGLPPFNGFVSEFLIYFSALTALCSGNAAAAAAGAFVLIALALTGGIAAAAFAKLCGAVFLGEARSPEAENAVEAPKVMILPVLVMVLGAFALTLSFPLIAGALNVDLQIILLLKYVALISMLTLLLFAIIFIIRFYLLPGSRGSRRSCTWDCGYAAPDARMEYTGSAFIQNLTDFFHPVLRGHRHVELPQGDFPESAAFEESFPDPCLNGFWGRIFNKAGILADKIHLLQSGSLHFYILVMTIVLIAMLVWSLLLPWSGTIISGGGAL